MGWIFIGITACVLLGWYLYRRLKSDTSENTDQAEDIDGDDGYEDLLLTGLMLSEVYDEEDKDSSENMDSDDQVLMDDGGFDDGGGLE